MRRTSVLLALLVLTAAILTSYLRFFLGYPICGTDEQNYLKIFDWLDHGGSWPISGPGYAALILDLRSWTGCDVRSLVTAVAMLNSTVILPLGLWAFYRFSLDNPTSAWGCLLLLFSGSYFLGPWIEGRPQQFGMLLAAMGAWLAHRDLQRHGQCGPLFFLLWVGCFRYHALSFVVLTTLVFGYWARQFLQKRSGYGTLAALLLGLASCLTLGAWWYPLIWLDIHTNHIQGVHVSIFFGAIAVTILAALVLLQGLRLHQTGVRLACWLRTILALPFMPWLAAGGAGLALIWQYAWLGPIYSDIPLLTILWYQGGNVLLAVLFLIGFWRWNQKPIPELEFFLESCLILMILGGVFLLLTPWLRDQNWMLRIITYWTWYAAPIAAWGWKKLPTYWLWGLPLLCLPLLIGGLQHVALAPTWTCHSPH